MCGIAGLFDYSYSKIDNLTQKLTVMSRLIEHRGPDDDGVWTKSEQFVGLCHRRLSIIDLSSSAHQPMQAQSGEVIVFNGEIYNHVELREQLKSHWQFTSDSDTEVILAAYHRYGTECVNHLKGMFSFVIWDGDNLFCARDRFGIKPFYYSDIHGQFIFASEAKALLPFLPDIKTDRLSFAEYITFQYPMGEKTLFQDIYQLEPAHAMLVSKNGIKKWRYWDMHFNIDYHHTPNYFYEKLQSLIDESVSLHLRSDVEVGAYVSGGVDSSLIGLLAANKTDHPMKFFHGRFLEDKIYDESEYAQHAAKKCNATLNIKDINSSEFVQNFETIMYHMDFPVAGPGVFPQFMVSEMAAKNVKVVLGGQGGDEIFGGYARYLIAYFEQCIKASIEGSYKQGNFVVTAESIIPNLEVLKSYKPLLKRFWSKGLFDSLEKRYFTLVNRSLDLEGEVQLSEAENEHVYARFLDVYNMAKFERAESYLDSMTHFDFKCLLPGLLHVEDRVSMAHGLEARVPFLYHPLIEFVSTIPADIKFKDGRMKDLLKNAYQNILPSQIINRKDKMGFPVPLSEWIAGDLREFVFDILISGNNRQDSYIDFKKVLDTIDSTGKFSRKIWGFLCYEKWQQVFHDKAAHYRSMLNDMSLSEKF
jgi:asparagine synthase (glutamine-hydrolysing)